MANRLSLSPVNGVAPMGAGAAARAAAGPGVAVIGLDGAGKRTLIQALATAGAGVEYRLESRTGAASPACGVLLVLKADTPPQLLDKQLHEFAELLQHWITERGRNLEVGGLPVYLVLTHIDLLPGFASRGKDWSEQVERRKAEWLAQVKARLSQPASDAARGFGSLDLKAWAVAQPRGKAGEAFGQKDLALAIERDATNYKQRVVGQSPRIRLVTVTTSLLVLALIVAAAAWGVLRLVPFGPIKPPDSSAQASSAAAEGERLLRAGERLLSFSDYSPRTGVDWLAWSAQANQWLKAERELAQHLQQNEGKDQSDSAAALAALRADLEWLQYSAALLGLLPEPEEVAGLLHFAAPRIDPTREDYEATLALANVRVAKLESQPSSRFWRTPMPGRIPGWVADALRHDALDNQEKLLRPVAAEMRRRVLALGDGKESVAAWQELASGWLTKEAPAELATWRALVCRLGNLGGLDRGDPLFELQAYLRTEQALPLWDGVILRLPPPDTPVVVRLDNGRETTVLVGSLEPIGPLIIERRPPGQAEAIRYELERAAAKNDKPRFVLSKATAAQHADGLLIARPGDQFRATLEIRDPSGGLWMLSWIPQDNPAEMSGLANLLNSPRLHAVKQTDPLTGWRADSVRLVFPNAAPLRLPLLLSPATRAGP